MEEEEGEGEGPEGGVVRLPGHPPPRCRLLQDRGEGVLFPGCRGELWDGVTIIEPGG